MRFVVWSGVLAALTVSLSAGPALAQDPPFGHIQLTRVVVKPGMTDTFEAHVKLLNEARSKAGDTVGRTMWQVGRGGPARTFFVTQRFDKWAELESLTMNRDALVKAFGEREGARIGDALSATIESAESQVLSVWKGMSSWKDGTYGYAWVTESQVRPAAIPQWEQQVAARAAAAKKSPASPPTLRYRTTLGPSAHFVSARFFDKWSDVDGWPELKDLAGQAEADRIDGLARGALESGTNYILRRRPELTYTPAK